MTKFKVGDKVLDMADAGLHGRPYREDGYPAVVEAVTSDGYRLRHDPPADNEDRCDRERIPEQVSPATKSVHPSNTLTTIPRLIRRATRSGRRTGEALRAYLQKATGKDWVSGWSLWHAYLRKHTTEAFTKDGYDAGHTDFAAWPDAIRFLFDAPKTPAVPVETPRPFQVGDKVRDMAGCRVHGLPDCVAGYAARVVTVPSLDQIAIRHDNDTTGYTRFRRPYELRHA